MKFSFRKRLETFQNNGLNTITELNGSREKLIIKIAAAIIVVLAIVNAVLLGLINSKAKALYQDKKAMSESLSKISADVNKETPAKAILQSDFMDMDMLTNYTGIILKKINDIINKKDTIITSVKSIAEVTKYGAFDISGINDIRVIQNKLKELTDYSKKLFDYNEQLSAFVLKIASLTSQSLIDQNELKKKINASPENVCLPILENIEKNKKTAESLQQDITAKASTIAELKKTVEAASTNKNEFQQIIQQNQSELNKVKDEYSKLKTQIENIKKQPNAEKTLAAVTAAPAQKISYPEFYYNLKGKVMEYNSKWGFIIINFGSDSKLNVNIDGKEKEVNVPVPLDKEVYIARADKFIAKAKIINVYSRYSVANIIFPVAEEIKKGDNVFFDQPKSK